MAQNRNRKPRDWAKLHLAWFTSPNHAHLSDAAHAAGLLLVVLANRSKVWGSVLVIQGQSAAATCARMLGRAIGVVESALSELCEVGTINVHPDGSLSFPNFESWQETSDAERKRKDRARAAAEKEERRRSASSESPSTVPGLSAESPPYARACASDLSLSGSLDLISEEGVQREEAPRPLVPASLGPPSTEPFDAVDLVQAWEDNRRGMMEPQLMLSPLESQAVIALRQPLEWWRSLFERASESPFLRGEVSGFAASLRWVIKNHALILAGRYDGRVHHGYQEHRIDALTREMLAS